MIQNHITRAYKGIVLERMRHLPVGGRMGDLPVHLQHDSFLRTGDKKTGGPNMRLLRLQQDVPSLTVTAYIFNKFVHPTEHRYITPREAACLQDFPVQWHFMGTLGQTHHQVGNAVPVKMAKAVALSVADYLVQQGYTGEIPVFSYFCGAGGFDLGFEQAKSASITFNTIFCTDIDVACGETIKKNRPEWNFTQADITKLCPENILKSVAKKPVVMIGGPPCQTFSVAGKQKATTDPLGQLYRDYVRHVAVLSPEIVIMENVYGLKQVKSAHVLAEIEQAFAKIGYRVRHQELLAADYGTPQMRRRLIFVATKKEKSTIFRFPEPTHMPEKNMFNQPVYNGAGAAFMHLPAPVYDSGSRCSAARVSAASFAAVWDNDDDDAYDCA